MASDRDQQTPWGSDPYDPAAPDAGPTGPGSGPAPEAPDAAASEAGPTRRSVLRWGLGGVIALAAIGTASYGSISSASAGRDLRSALTIIAPAAAGGGWDTAARSIQQVMTATGLAKSFGGIKAVENVDIAMRDRKLHALIGPNGAGKTTAFNLISGMFAPDRGEVRLREHDIAGLSPEAITRAGIGRAFQITNLFPTLSVAENVRLAVQARAPERFGFWRSAGALGQARLVAIAASPAGVHDRRASFPLVPRRCANLDLIAVTTRFATGRPMVDAAESSACKAVGDVSGSTAKSRPAAKLAIVPTERGR